MIAEFFLAFLVLFAIISYLTFNLKNYLKPKGFSQENVYRLEVKNFGSDNENADAQEAGLISLKMALQNLENTKYVSRSGNNTPYSNHTWTKDKEIDGRKEYFTHVTIADDQFHKVLNLNIKEGRWFSTKEPESTYVPIVINRYFKEALFDSEKAIGQVFDEKFKIVGVIDDYRYKGDFESKVNFFFAPIHSLERKSHTFIIRSDIKADIKFEIELAKTARKSVNGWTVDIVHMDDLRKEYYVKSISQLTTGIIIALFLVLNVILGTTGVLWYNITRRTPEIGLRKALGASTGNISAQITSEMLVLTIFGLIPGYLFILNLWFLKLVNLSTDIYVIAALISTLFIVCIVSICSYYPSRMAAKVHPAIALNIE